MKQEVFEQLGAELDSESWNWLVMNYPRIADSLEAAVMRGASPDSVKAFVLRRCGYHRNELATRCESASRHLMRSE